MRERCGVTISSHDGCGMMNSPECVGCMKAHAG
jgi:hypothetical protein